MFRSHQPSKKPTSLIHKPYKLTRSLLVRKRKKYCPWIIALKKENMMTQDSKLFWGVIKNTELKRTSRIILILISRLKREKVLELSAVMYRKKILLKKR